MKITVELKGEREFRRALEKMSEEKAREIKGEVYASGHDIRTEAQSRLRDQEVHDTGNLKNSIMVNLKKGGMVADICPEAPYAPYVEYGARPHFPPPDALERWARKHGFESAWPICLAIARRGLPARPFLFPAWLAVKDKFWKRIREILAR